MKIDFIKMNGLGNDYIFIDTVRNKIPYDIAEFTRVVSDRHFGIGGDGVVLIGYGAANTMRIFNADGSEAENCGNALRCVARYLYDEGITSAEAIPIITKAGVKVAQIDVLDAQTLVTVNMGVPRMLDGNVAEYDLVSVGNPHAVRIVRDFAAQDIAAARELSQSYKGGINVELVQIIDRLNVKIWVYERGSGETLACGTGATATVYALRQRGLVDQTTVCNLLGGDLTVTDEDGIYYMKGVANYNFKGTYEYLKE